MAARYGLSVEDVQATAATAVGGEQIGEKIEGLARFPSEVRFPREMRDSVQALRQLPILPPSGAVVTLGLVADIALEDGPTLHTRVNAPPADWRLVHGATPVMC